MKKKLLIATGGGDCPGLNAVIRAIVKRASIEEKDEWQIIGSYDAFNGILSSPMELMNLTMEKVSGIHVQGGTIIGTTNKGGPFNWPTKDEYNNPITIDRSDELVRIIKEQKIDGVVNIGGDGSQRISQRLYEKGCPIVGVPKTIDNDLSCTDFTFGFQTAVECATAAIGKLVTTAQSHHRIFILEVMGRYAGWIALHAAIAGGAEVCLIPEIPYDIEKIKVRMLKRFLGTRSGFAVIVVAEGARPIGGSLANDGKSSFSSNEIHLKGAGERLLNEINDLNFPVDARLTVLGHLQRGGSPNPFDRILASQFGIKAFELVKNKQFGKMVSYQHPDIAVVNLKDAVKTYNLVKLDSSIIKTARGLDICLGD